MAPPGDPGAQPWYNQLWNGFSQNYASDPSFWFSAMAPALGILGGLLQSNSQNERYAQAQKAAQGPVNWQQFYQPMSEQAQAAMRRSTMADLATRGLPADSAYATALTAERFGGMEGDMIQRAMQLAQQQRQSYLNTLMNAPQGAGAAMSGAGSAMGSLGQWAAYQQMLRTRQAAQQQYGRSAASPGGTDTQNIYQEPYATSQFGPFSGAAGMPNVYGGPQAPGPAAWRPQLGGDQASPLFGDIFEQP